MKGRMKAPQCRDCVHFLHSPFTAGYCRRRLMLTWDGKPQHPRIVDERLDRCGVLVPRFFEKKG